MTIRSLKQKTSAYRHPSEWSDALDNLVKVKSVLLEDRDGKEWAAINPELDAK